MTGSALAHEGLDWSSPTDDRWQLVTLAAITTVTALVSSLGAPLVPQIATDEGVPLGTAQWALTATLLAGAAATPVIGRWGSGRLRRPVVLGGLVVVLVGTTLSALPLGLGTLVAGRALQGVGLALVPMALAVARDLWSDQQLAARLSLLSVTTVAGAGLGYPLTAQVAGTLGIEGAFWFGSAVLAITLALAHRHLPRQATGVPQQVDLAGVALLSVGTVALLLAVSRGEHWGWTAAATLALAACGATLVVGWMLWTLGRTRRGRLPLVDLALALRPGVLAPNVVTFGIGLGMYGLLTLVVVLVQADGSDGFGLGYGVAVTGWILVPYAVLSVSGNWLARQVALRGRQHLLLPIGCAVFASAMLFLAVAHDHLWQVLVSMALGGIGSGFTFSSLPMLIVPHLPPEETGSAMAFNQLLRYLGFSVGSATSVALVEVYGGGGSGFRAALATLAGVCLLTGLGAAIGAFRGSKRRTYSI